MYATAAFKNCREVLKNKKLVNVDLAVIQQYIKQKDHYVVSENLIQHTKRDTHLYFNCHIFAALNVSHTDTCNTSVRHKSVSHRVNFKIFFAFSSLFAGAG